jgi:hypothetical protein
MTPWRGVRSMLANAATQARRFDRRRPADADLAGGLNTLTRLADPDLATDLTLLAERDTLAVLGHPFYDRDSEATEVAGGARNDESI